MPLYRMAAAVLVIVAALLAITSTCPATATAVTRGSITIETVHHGGGATAPLSGDTWRLAQVATATIVDGGSVTYTTTGAFASLDRDWAHLDASCLCESARELTAYAQEHDLLTDGEAVTDAAGRATFSNLAPGLYLAVRTDLAVSNQHLICDPVLVSVPQDEAGTLIYNITVGPKFEDTDTPSDDTPDNPSDNPSDQQPSSIDEAWSQNTSQQTESGLDRLLHALGLPQTGDAQGMYIALAVMLAAACIAVGCLAHRRAARKAASASQGSASPTSPAAEREAGHQPDGEDTSSGESGPDDNGQDPA